jgi:uncharacterized damage-inducible protein DinB
MEHDDLYMDRGAFFGSIMRTLNHLLWGDSLWMSRFGAGFAPDVSYEDSFEMAPTPAVWAADRFRLDAKISLWSESLNAVDLVGDLDWTNTQGEANTEKWWICVTHFFNHQTHHRGQVHAMLTAAGQKPQDTDLTYIPEAP